MPWFKKGPGDRTKVFDAFVAIAPEDDLVVSWPDAILTDAQRDLLGRIVSNLSFLGRAESWCDARLLDETDATLFSDSANCAAADGGALISRDLELVRTLCPDPATTFGDEHVVAEREGTVEVTVEGKKGPKTRKQKQTVTVAIYDPNWHLCMETLRLHDERWSDPPGSRWVQYARRRDCFKVAPTRRPLPGAATRPQIARFVLDSTVLPLITDTLPIAEATRRNLMGVFGRLHTELDGSRGRSAVLAGKDADGQPLRGHRHAFYLPTDEDGDGRLDHLTIVAEEGFGPGEVRALQRLPQIRTAEREASGSPLRVLLLGLGALGEGRAGPTEMSALWTSATPFIVTRHLKKNGRKRDPRALWYNQAEFVATVLREELARLMERRPEMVGVSVADIVVLPLVDERGHFRCGVRQLRPIQFKRVRHKRDDDGSRRPAGTFQITFPVAVRGPIALGHSAHYGMGLFVPCLHASQLDPHRP
jgi:CRISPR-associated protein Csb2